jgi:hypothetical protein
MKKDKVWGGHPEAETSNQILQSMGFKGLEIYEEIEPIDSRVSKKYKKLVHMTGALKRTNELPSVKLLLQGVSRGGQHYTTLIV